MDRNSDNRSRKEWKEVPVGGIVEHRGHVFKCVKRGRVYMPSDACSGCAMSGDICGRHMNCDPFKCSKFSRYDGNDVWFVLAEGDDVEG